MIPMTEAITTFAQAEERLSESLPGYESRLLALTGLTEGEFWMRTDQMASGCWEWSGSRYQDSYGRVWCPGDRKHVRAHRVAFELGHHEEAHQHVLHTCDNPPCCNPAHLFLGNDKDNSQDALAKGRLVIPESRCGHDNVTAILTWEQVREMRALYAAGETQVHLAQRFRTHQTNVSLIVNNKTWRES